MVSAVGMPLVKMQLELIDAAIEAGVKRFLPSEFGFDLTLPQNRAEKVYGMKVAIADKLKEAAERNPGFTYTLVSNGEFCIMFAVPKLSIFGQERKKGAGSESMPNMT